jgi:hypothetical protein
MLAVCGLWTLVASTNPQCLGAELFVDYNTVTFTPVQRFPLGRLKKNKYASMYVDGEVAKILWSDKVQYEVQSDFFPRILLPAVERTPRMTVTYALEEPHLTVVDRAHKYTFRRDVSPRPAPDHLFKIFLTQLFFDFVIREIYKVELPMP